MKYLFVNWNHNFIEEPIYIVSEINADDWETRKIEIFRNGDIGYADRERHSNNTLLSEDKIPAIEKINRDPQFNAMYITNEVFDAFYRVAHKDLTLS